MIKVVTSCSPYLPIKFSKLDELLYFKHFSPKLLPIFSCQSEVWTNIRVHCTECRGIVFIYFLATHPDSYLKRLHLKARKCVFSTCFASQQCW